MTLNITYLKDYQQYLYEQERSQQTIEKYTRDIGLFLRFLGQQEVSKIQVRRYKEFLCQSYAPSSVNSMVAAVNGFLVWLGLPSYKVKLLKMQKPLFIQPEKELTRKDYERLIQEAERQHNCKLSLLIQTICATGIRVSELSYITVESLQTGRTMVFCKGKHRMVFLPKMLCRALKAYCKACKVVRGSIFITRTGRPLDRSNIWKMMKRLCEMAKVAQEKVFPHNLRHLFACTHYKKEKDIGRLADILGHSNIQTTRIYTMETGTKHATQINQLNLVYSEPMYTT